MKSRLILKVCEPEKKFIIAENNISTLEDFDLFVQDLPTLINDKETFTVKDIRVTIQTRTGKALFNHSAIPESTVEGYKFANLSINSKEAIDAVSFYKEGGRIPATIFLWVTYNVDGGWYNANTYYGQANTYIYKAPTQDGVESSKAISTIEAHNADENAHSERFQKVETTMITMRDGIIQQVEGLLRQEESKRNEAITIALREQGIDSIPNLVTGAAKSAEAAAISAEVASKILLQTTEDALVVKEDKRVVSEIKREVEETKSDIDTSKKLINEKVNTFNTSYNEAKDVMQQFYNYATPLPNEILTSKNDAIQAVAHTGNELSRMLASQAGSHALDLDKQAETISKELDELAKRGEGVKDAVDGAISQLQIVNETVKASTELANTTLGKVEDAEKELSNQLADFEEKAALVNGSVGKAEAAKTGAETAQGKAEEAAKDAENVSKSVEETALVATDLAENVANANRYTMVLVSNGQLLDRCINHLSDGVTSLTLPTQVDAKKVRDFMVVSVGATGLTFEGGTLLPRDGDDAMLVPEDGTNVFMFTEISSNKFLVSRAKVVEQ